MAGKPSATLWAIGGAALITDQVSKYVMLSILQNTPNGVIPVLPFLDAALVWNKGVSYGFLQAGSTMASLALIAMSLVITGIMAYFLWHESARWARFAYALIISGAMGNVIDRALHGAVIDFISPHAFGYHWYVFNVADIWISCGAALLIFSAFFSAKNTSSER